ncbi:MAG: hypothetical protein R2877_07765 [Bdellovibrionota bacterium]
MDDAMSMNMRLRRNTQGQAMIEYVIVAGALVFALFSLRYSDFMDSVRDRVEKNHNLLHQPLP